MVIVWLLQGTHDQFSALRKELAELEEVATLETLHAREVDAVQSEYSKDWLLVSVLRTLMPTLRRAGVIALRPRRPHCPLCFDTYDPDDTYATRVRLVNFVPCGHWLCGRCFEGKCELRSIFQHWNFLCFCSHRISLNNLVHFGESWIAALYGSTRILKYVPQP